MVENQPEEKNMKILVCNAGSTSLKFKVYAFPEDTVLARGRV